MAVKKERQLNYELLRIIAMLMIVSLHYLGKVNNNEEGRGLFKGTILDYRI
jgi:surface polysaccharide O-acyltransferase-like enzyme